MCSSKLQMHQMKKPPRFFNEGVSGAEGIRTPVLNQVTRTYYMFRQVSFVRCCRLAMRAVPSLRLIIFCHRLWRREVKCGAAHVAIRSGFTSASSPLLAQFYSGCY